MPNEHRADPTPPPHHGQGRGGSKKESFSLRVSPALHPPERPPHVTPTWPIMALVGRRGNEGCILCDKLPIVHFLVFITISRIADGPHSILPVVTKDLPISSRLVHALRIFIAMQVQHSYNSSTNG